MSILQQGHPQGELCLAHVCKEGIAIRRGDRGHVRRRGALTSGFHCNTRLKIKMECSANNEANV